MICLLLVCFLWASGSLSAAQILISPAGGKFAEAQRVVLSWDDPEEFRPLRYTLDGSEPDETSPMVLPPVAIDITVTATLKVRVWDGSEYATASFVIGPEVLEFAPKAGAYVEGTTITLTAPYASDAIIHYTLDGSIPSVSSPVYSSPVTLSSNVQFNAFVWRPEHGAGLVQSVSYYTTTTPVTFDPPAGEVLRGTTVTLTSSPGAALYYVFSPTVLHLRNLSSLAWVPYVEPLLIDADTVIYAKAEKSGQLAAYTHAAFSVPRLPRPNFSPERGPISADASVTITSAFAGAVIRYTLDGTEPSEASPEYTEPVTVGVSGRLKARTFHPQYAASYTCYTFYRGAGKPVVPPPSDDLPKLKFTKVAETDRAVWITHAGDGSGRLFIVQLNGTIGILGRPTPFLSLPYDPFGGLIFGSPPPAEILSVAFPPLYDEKARFYCSYRTAGGVRVSKFFALAHPDVADPQSEIVLGTYPVTGEAGQLIFGPDGTLYLNKIGPIASHMPASFFQDSEVLSTKLLAILTESGGEEAVEPTPGRWPFRGFFENITVSTTGALPYRGPFRRMQGRYFCGDRSGKVFTVEQADAGVVSKSLAYPQFLDPLNPLGGGLGEPPRYYPFDIVAMGEDEEGRLYVSNYGKTYYMQVNGGPAVEARQMGGGIYRVGDDETVFGLLPELASGGGLKLSWHTVTGLQYQIQTSEDLINWQDYLTPFSGTGDAMQVNDSGTSVPSKFYRIRTEPGAPETP